MTPDHNIASRCILTVIFITKSIAIETLHVFSHIPLFLTVTWETKSIVVRWTTVVCLNTEQ
jgi:hypothetical protein